jgi:hypothetical protein
MDPDGGDREDGEAKSYPDCYYRAYRNLSLIARNYTRNVLPCLPNLCIVSNPVGFTFHGDLLFPPRTMAYIITTRI